MAGLPLFGGTFQHWIGGGTPTTPKQTNIDAKVHMSMSNRRSMEALQSLGSGSATSPSRTRQAGIREHTDESCDLPRSKEIMQHLAESCRNNDNVQHTGIDGRRLTSYGSTVTNHNVQNEIEATHHAYDTIEAEIDQLKEDIAKLREGAEHDRKTPKIEQEAGSERALSAGSRQKQSMSTEATIESAAARLQRQHEAKSSKGGFSSQEQSTMQQLPSPLDFPALEGSNQSSAIASPIDPDFQQRKPSYANTASSGIMDVMDHAFIASMPKRANMKTSDSTSEAPLSTVSMLSCTQTSSTAATVDSDENKEEEDYSVIISPRSDETDSSTNEPVIVWKGVQSAKNGKPAKHQPRFAQPTQSFSRRTGETLRPASSPISPKSSPGGSPTKTTRIKEPILATDKRAAQREQKRKSFPGDWLGAGTQQQHGIANAPTTKAGCVATPSTEKASPPVAGVPSSAVEGWQRVEVHQAKENATMMRAKARDLQGQSTIQSKTKSYMASTSAAMQRSIATLGQDKAKHEQPETERVALTPIETPNSQSLTTPHRCSTTSSEVSSVQFIVDQPRPDFSLAHITRDNKNHDQGTNPQNLQVKTKIPAAVSPSRLAFPRDRTRTSPSKLPTLSSRTERSTQHPSESGYFPFNKLPSTFGQLPQVANTTTKRRTSRGHILQPIVACLDAKGLLNKTSTNNAVVESYLKNMSNGAAINATSAPSDKTSQLLNHVLETTRTTPLQNDRNPPVVQAIAPHLRVTREVSRASTSTNATLCPKSISPTSFTQPPHVLSSKTNLELTSCTPPCATPLGQSSRVSSLRATADEFKPITTAKTHLSQVDIQDIIKRRSFEEWSTLNWNEKQAVINLRVLFDQGSWTAPHPVRLHSSPPWAPTTSTRFPDGESTTIYGSGPNANSASVNDHGSPNGVKAGQTLRPTLSPGKKSVHWLLRDVDGTETPIKFGRAPPPNISPIWEPPTPTISLNSNDTSPLKTPHSTRGWQIGSASSSMPYGWRGGDGKEIKFVGYGPHAERDPKSIVNFNFQGCTASYNASVPNGFEEDKENRPSEPHLAPKSQRQWAEKFGYPRVPCGNVEITDAVEHCIPFGSQLAGYCYDCAAK